MIIKKIESDSMTGALKRAKDIFGVNAKIHSTRTLKNGRFQIIASAKEIISTAINEQKERRGNELVESNASLEEFVSERKSMDSIKEQISTLNTVVNDRLLEFSETLHKTSWGIEGRTNPSLPGSLSLLIANGVDYKEAKKLSVNLPRSQAPANDMVIERLMSKARISNNLERGIHCLIGPTGSGKTSSLIKIAMKKHDQDEQICIVVGEANSPGAYEDMMEVGSILGIDIYSSVEEVPRDIYSYVFLDNPSKDIIASNKVTKHLVVSTSSNIKVYDQYKSNNIDSIIITKVDEIREIGIPLTISKKLNASISFISSSSDISKDIKDASNEYLMELINKQQQHSEETDVLYIANNYGES
jgi:flagellar biosynthesis GTPase FlhF